MNHYPIRAKPGRSESTVYHDEEEKQVYEDRPMETSEQSEAPHRNHMNMNHVHPSKPLPPMSPPYAAPPAAFSQNFTYVPPQPVPPIRSYSSQVACASPKTHFAANALQFNANEDEFNKRLSPHNKMSRPQAHHQKYHSSEIPKPKAIHEKTHSQPIMKNAVAVSHPMARQLVDMGFNQNHVERACKIFKKNFPTKPFRLEVLTEIIIRLQTKDAANNNNEFQVINHHYHHHHAHHEPQIQEPPAAIIDEMKQKPPPVPLQLIPPPVPQSLPQPEPSPPPVALQQSGTALIGNAPPHNMAARNMDIGHDINSLNINIKKGGKKLIINRNQNQNENNENVMTAIEVILSSSIKNREEKKIKRRRYEIRMGSAQTLKDLKSQMILTFGVDVSDSEYVFYHNDSGLLFNSTQHTIAQCQMDLANANVKNYKLLSLKVGRMVSISRAHHVATPSLGSKRLSSPKLSAPPPPPQRAAAAATATDKDAVAAVPSEMQLEEPPAQERGRRSTKIEVISNKIASERRQNFREIISYVKDSPFWWKKMDCGIERVRKLTSRLKSIASLISDLCNLLKKFSAHCSKISSDVMKSWADVENEFAGDMLSLNAQFFNLGETIETLSAAAGMLSTTLSTVIVDEFNKFCDYHLNNLLASNKLLHSRKNEYEMSLRQSNLNQTGNKNKNSKFKSSTDLNNLRREFELSRYDQCVLLNSIINKNRFDIILTLCAAFSGFETFFHLGYESAMSYKEVHDSIRMGIPDKFALQEAYVTNVIDKNRSLLVAVMNDGKSYNDYKHEIKANSKSDKKQMNHEMQTIIEEHGMSNNDENARHKQVSLDYYDGYLWKQASKSKKKWQKRWFVLTNGELEYFRGMNQWSKAVQSKAAKAKAGKAGQSKEYIGNTALCKVKRCLEHEYKYVFEIITPSQRTYVLQAQTLNEYDEWFYVLSNQVARLLLRKSTAELSRSSVPLSSAAAAAAAAAEKENKKEETDEEKLKRQIFALTGNDKCADCAQCSPRPTWCSINIGVLLCIHCCGVHRDLGTHVSKMRSLELDNVSPVTLECIVALGGNEALNSQLLEYNLNLFDPVHEYKKIDYRTCNANQRSNFIRNKYIFKMFSKQNKNFNSDREKEKEELLWNCVANDDLFGVVACLYYGADINHQFAAHNDETVLHCAVKQNATQMVQLLCHNDAQIRIEDGNEQLPHEIAIQLSLQQNSRNNGDCMKIQQILKDAAY